MDQGEKNDRFLGALAYGFGWVSAIYFMNATRRAIRWHAFQSIVVFGGLTLSIIAADSIFPRDAGALNFLLHTVSMSALLIISTALWVLLPLQTFRGKPFLVPVFAPLTKKIAGEPPWTQPVDSNSGGPAAHGPNTPWGSPSGGESTPCGSCGGSGQMTCSSCGGRGSWYEQPTTATGSAQLRSCTACISSGRVACVSCSGTGRAPALI